MCIRDRCKALTGSAVKGLIGHSYSDIGVQDAFTKDGGRCSLTADCAAACWKCSAAVVSDRFRPGQQRTNTETAATDGQQFHIDIIAIHGRRRSTVQMLLLLLLVIIITSLPKVIWEHGRVAAKVYTYAVKSPIAKPHYLSHAWIRPTYDAKRHPDPIHRFFTMHWTHRQTDRQIDRRIVHGKV